MYIVRSCDATFFDFVKWGPMSYKFITAECISLSALTSCIGLLLKISDPANLKNLMPLSFNHDDLILGTAWKLSFAFSQQINMNYCQFVLYICSVCCVNMCSDTFCLSLGSFSTYVLYIFVLSDKVYSVIALKSPNYNPNIRHL